ncbi:type I secretion C-terminal target domain-containing protein, partial [Pseudomonas chlororaphis]|nr:type I secretion C-terminal target domain-containing protein [Pseudomonas chlororaphis]
MIDLDGRVATGDQRVDVGVGPVVALQLDRHVCVGDTGNDVIKDFKASEGDRIDLRDLLQGESASTIDNFLKITTVDGTSTLQVSSEGKLNAAGG